MSMIKDFLFFFLKVFLIIIILLDYLFCFFLFLWVIATPNFLYWILPFTLPFIILLLLLHLFLRRFLSLILTDCLIEILGIVHNFFLIWVIFFAKQVIVWFWDDLRRFLLLFLMLLIEWRIEILDDWGLVLSDLIEGSVLGVVFHFEGIGIRFLFLFKHCHTWSFFNLFNLCIEILWLILQPLWFIIL